MAPQTVINGRSISADVTEDNVEAENQNTQKKISNLLQVTDKLLQVVASTPRHGLGIGTHDVYSGRK
jgi:hypothetical protein